MNYTYIDEELARANLGMSSSYSGIINVSTLWKGSLITIVYNSNSNVIEDIWYPYLLNEDEITFLGSLLGPDLENY